MPDPIKSDGLPSPVEPRSDWSNVRAVYDAFDESHSYLGAGFNSFGFWRGLPEHELRVGTLAALQMYDIVAQPLVLGAKGKILELGSGLGSGTANLCDTFREFQFTGLDFSISQVRRSMRQIVDERRRRLSFVQADATQLPFNDQQFVGALSVEAIQHIPLESHGQLFQEVHRVLAPKGRFSFATFLLRDDSYLDRVEKLLWTVRERFDFLISVEHVTACAENAGLKIIECQPLGDHVFHDVYRFVDDKTTSWQDSKLDSFRQDALTLFGGFHHAFEEGWLDYYRVLCSR